jgi:hypothetical protein
MFVVAVNRTSGNPGMGGSIRESITPRLRITWTPTPTGTMIVIAPHPV